MNQENESLTPINMALPYYMILTDLIRLKNEAYWDQNLAGYYKALYSIHNLVYFKIKDNPEEKELAESFSEARKKIHERKPKQEAGDILKKVDNMLMIILHKNHMIFPNFTKSFGFEGVRKRYGMGENSVEK